MPHHRSTLPHPGDTGLRSVRQGEVGAGQTYIGSRTSRVDGPDKVTGKAKYAGEFNAPNLAHASIVGSAIAKGRIASIDISGAMKIGGVIAVLTHENRPAMADTDKAYKDDVAPEKGSPFRPLYDDKIMFCGYFPAGLTLERQFADMPNVPFRDHVWPKFLRENALRVFKIPEAIARATGTAVA